ncbi:CPBP family intramembrane glutamic endopeptidase [Microbacterium sp.]|uniref:CPBP family intramembrane glutamic endopeptidase n=1 Tax=Microbacterium sp. TaxID=51671 RepID=UPI003F95EB07
MSDSQRQVPAPDTAQSLDPRTAVRAATVFVVATLALVTLICAVFLVSGAPLPDWFTIVGRWIPAVVSFVVILSFGLSGSVTRWWMLRPGKIGTLLSGLATGVLGLVLIYAVAAAIGIALGFAAPLPLAAYLQIAVLTVPAALLFSVSTFGEEVAWRAFLPQLLPGVNRWARAVVISGIWVVFHIPLHGTMILQGSLPPVTGVVSTVLLLPLGIFLAMLVERFGSVWPAVIAHAVPMSVLNLVAGSADLSAPALWGLAAVTTVALTAGAIIVAPARR